MIRQRIVTTTALGLFVAALGCGKPETAPKQGPASAESPSVPMPPKKAAKADETDQQAQVTPDKPNAAKTTEPTSVAPKELSGTEAPKVKKAAEKKTASKPQKAAKDVVVKEVDIAGFEKFVAENKGKFVVVDNWATWCIPCREKFPKFASMSKELAGKDVVFVALDHDDDEAKLEAVADFLAGHPGSYVNLRMTDDLYDVQEKLDFEGIPRYFVYDKDGKMAVNTGDVEEMSKKLHEMLNKS
jgi:thiol-disulfide isomerase/thioredoxin